MLSCWSFLVLKDENNRDEKYVITWLPDATISHVIDSDAALCLCPRMLDSWDCSKNLVHEEIFPREVCDIFINSLRINH